MKWALLVAALELLACRPGEIDSRVDGGRPAPRQPLLPPRAKLPGDARVYRFLDHAGEAKVTGPDLSEAWRAFDHPAKIVSPYSGLRGAAAMRVIELALADADVASYGQPRSPSRRRAKLPQFDPVWNRTRAVYESKTALFAPTPFSYEFLLPPLASGELRVELGTPPGAGAVEFRVEADGREIYRHSLAAAESGSWLPARIPLKDAQRVSFITDGRAATAAVWANPELVVPDAGAPGMNLLLVVIDTLRVDALPVMPRLRALARSGVQFEQAITAATWTRPSILAMLGGDLPTAIGQSAEEMIPADAERRRFYAVAPPLLPRVLEQAGYRSTAIGNNFFLLGYPQIGLALGFDEVADIRHPVLDTPAISRAAIAFLQTHARESFFLHLHFDAPHWPYAPPREYRERITVPAGFPEDSLARDYLAEAAYADDHLGRVLDELERQHLRERTLVVVVGDHGEVFDHAHAHTVDAMQQPTLHHHGWAAYDELLRVPLVMALPGTLPPATVKSQVSLVDLEPTVREVLGLPARPNVRGRSLAPLWRGVAEPERPAFVEGQNVRAVRAGGWVYLRRSDGRLSWEDGRHRRVDEELYDLREDPLEHRDRTGDAPEALQRLRALFDRETPAARDAPVSVLHLRVAPDARPHTIEGTLRSEGTISIRAVAGAEASPLDAHAVHLTLRGAALVDVVVDPPTARIELALRRDGAPLPAGRLLLGPFGLPLLNGEQAAIFDGERLTWLDAARAPVFGDRGDVLLWRDPSAITPIQSSTARSNHEVAGMMRRWGYAQPGK